MDEPRRDAVARVVLDTGEDEPALDVQLADDVVKASERGLTVTAAYGTVGGPLNDARRGQVARLFEQLRALKLPAAIVFARPGPADLEFLGRQARVSGFSISVRHDRTTVATSWPPPAAEAPPG